jgi:ribonuclease P protein component
MRLTRKFSMTRHGEFSRAREQGQSKGGAYLVLSTLADNELDHHMAAVIVTRKVGNAVTRNRLRRRVHHIMAKHLDSIEGKRYIVTILRWRAPEASFEQLEADWLKQARRLGILTTHDTP